MNLNDLRTFVRVAATGTISGAAKELGVPKSTVSRRVARLEDELGLALLSRTGREVRLTPAGERLHDRAGPSLRALRDVERELADAHEVPRGTLRLTAPHDLGAADWFAELLVAYRARYPEVRVEVELTNRFVDLVGEGFDLALRPRRSSTSASLVARRVGLQTVALFASPRYLATRPAIRALEDLRDHRLVAHPIVTRGPLRLTHEDGREASWTPDAAFVANDFNLLANAMVLGEGIGLLVAFSARPHVEAGRLAPVLPEWRLDQRHLWLVWPKTRHLAPRVRAFVDLAMEHLTRLGIAGS